VSAWKTLERQTATKLYGRRILRLAAPEPSFLSCPDVELPEFPGLKIDAKYRARWSHHSFLETILRKYCKQPWHEPVLVTKARGQRGAYVTIRLEFLARLLSNCKGTNNDK
jgi:hypothetical protein